LTYIGDNLTSHLVLSHVRCMISAREADSPQTSGNTRGIRQEMRTTHFNSHSLVSSLKMLSERSNKHAKPNQTAVFLRPKAMTDTEKHLFPIYVRHGKNPENFTAGFIDHEGTIALEPRYEDAKRFSEGLAPVRLHGKWGAIDVHGNSVIPCTHEGIGLRFSEGRIRFTVGNCHGVLSSDGRVIVPPRYKAISSFAEGSAYVSNGKNFGFVDLWGNEFIPPYFEDALEFGDGLAPVQLGGKWGYIDHKAAFAIEAKFDFALPFHEGLARVAVGGRWGPYGYIKKTGEFAITPRFAHAYDFHEGLASVALEKNGPRGFIDPSGRFTIAPAYAFTGHFSEGLAGVTPVGDRLKHFIDREGVRAFAGSYLGGDDFLNGLCLVSTMETIAYINHRGETVWEGPYVAGKA